MNCPVCNRNNHVTLSICPSCGSMINDSVREELVGKVSAAKTNSAAKSNSFEIKTNTMPNKPMPIVKAAVPSKSIDDQKSVTSELAAKPTSPTLVEFHSKNATIPEWRLQLQNVVRQRQERDTQETTEVESPSATTRAKLVTSGANALKTETIEEPQPVIHNNPNLAKALERIASSRQKFLVEEQPQPEPAASVAKGNKNYPFYLAAKTSDVISKPAEVNVPINSFAKPKLASSLRTEKEKLDTNKLPAIPKPAEVAASFESRAIISETLKTTIAETEITETKVIETREIVETKEIEVEEFDDCAPFAMRFNAGLFDLIIGSFTSLILLSPFMILGGGSWLSTAGIFAFLATCSVVMFIYLTTSIGLHGRTFGMRLFSLELVDIESEDYPSFHQAAVSSAVYLLSLALGGAGFLTLLFNDDKRAVHDLVSGTIIVREET